jgi:ABC-type uncharacterized transport system substrate-binding protein
MIEGLKRSSVSRKAFVSYMVNQRNLGFQMGDISVSYGRE